jgi:cytochrome c2
MPCHGRAHLSLRLGAVIALTLACLAHASADEHLPVGRAALQPTVAAAPATAVAVEATDADEAAEAVERGTAPGQALMSDRGQQSSGPAPPPGAGPPAQVVLSDAFATQGGQATVAAQTPAPYPPIQPEAVLPAPAAPAAAAAGAPTRTPAEQALITRGNAAFQNACTQCHDAERSTSKTKDLPGWRATVRRMAGKSGADVPQSDWEAIATYLASLRAPAAAAAATTAAPAAPARSAAEQALIARGNSAFQSACTQCHDAGRSTSKSKDVAGWRATVRRMAGKNGANVPQGDWEAIATYLASLSAPAGAATGAAGSSSAAPPEQAFSLWATISPYWREGNDHMELPGFFPQTWVGANWQSTGPLSARVTACVTCHTEPGNGHRIETVEAAMRIDLGRWICERDTPIKAVVDAGRFIVPFGAFSAQVNPGVYRTVAKPLMFTMGQRVFATDIGDPVLPMPYADQGSNFSLAVPLPGKGTATFDAYVVNGLRGNASGIDFYQSRNYVDGNKEPAAGTRVTLGNQYVRLGSSLTAGRFNDDTGSGPRNQALYYRIYGFDIQAHYENLWRVQFEYADRDTDRIVNLPGLLLAREHISGLYLEGEGRLRKTSKFSILGRYDTLYHRAALPPPGSTLTTGRFDVMRTTLGVNYQLAGNSLLMVNWEHWHLPGNLPNQEVYGVRWAATF